MQRAGVAKLPLHYGKAPRWLTARMEKLAKEMVTIIIHEYGSLEFLRRISDPFWFQSLGCVLGYDWHSSGVTTVLTGVLKKAIVPENIGIALCGGKGRFSRQTIPEIANIGEKFGFSDEKISILQYASRMSAKVDNTAIQAGYQLYHHAFFITDKGDWAVVQQGMSTQDRTARRYHWLSGTANSFVVEPHNAIVGDVKRDRALDMTAKESEESRKASVDIAKDKPERFRRMVMSGRSLNQKSLREWMPKDPSDTTREQPFRVLNMPRNINWRVMQEVYEFQPRNYEELISFKGVGPATVRGLALVSQLIYGTKPSWKDPVRYSFAYGGKDGVPYPVNRKAMDESIDILKQAIQASKIGSHEKMHSLERLRKLIPDDIDK